MIQYLEAAYENKWNEYISSKKANYYYSISYKETIEKTYKHKSYYLMSYDSNDEVNGVLPLFLINSFFQKKMISIPYCPYGGVISDDRYIEERLVNQAIKMAKKMRCKFLELKGLGVDFPDLVSIKGYYTFHLSLRLTEEELWSNLSKSIKRKIKSALKVESKVVFNKDIDAFFSLYKTHMKVLGTPYIDFDFFDNLKKDDNVTVASIYYKNNIASSILLLKGGGIVVYDRGATNYELRNLNLNYLLFWEVIKKFKEERSQVFDFGRSVKESGTFQFKNGWRPEIKELTYYYYLINGAPLVINQSSRKRKIISSVFKRLPLGKSFCHIIRKCYP